MNQQPYVAQIPHGVAWLTLCTERVERTAQSHQSCLTKDDLAKIPYTPSIISYLRKDERFERTSLGINKNATSTRQNLEAWERNWNGQRR
jgi:hypothetical protein